MLRSKGNRGINCAKWTTVVCKTRHDTTGQGDRLDLLSAKHVARTKYLTEMVETSGSEKLGLCYVCAGFKGEDDYYGKRMADTKAASSAKVHMPKARYKEQLKYKE